jgi:hypothetical protein
LPHGPPESDDDDHAREAGQGKQHGVARRRFDLVAFLELVVVFEELVG